MIVEERGLADYLPLREVSISEPDYFKSELNNYLVDAYERLDEELINEKANKKAREANSDLVSTLLITTAGEMLGNTGMALMKAPLEMFMVFNLLYVVNTLYLLYSFKKGVKNSYDVYKKRYEDSAV